MYKGHKVLCIIPARAGSKGLPDKNVLHIAGKPLIAYTVEQAIQSALIDKVIVSTEDDRIADISKSYGAEIPFMRPESLAGDTSSIIDALLYTIDRLENYENSIYDIVVMLHVTSPLRNVEDIDNCIIKLVEEDADNVFSVTEAYRNPYFNMVELSEKNKVRLVKEGKHVNRQSAPVVFDMNASIYAWWKKTLKSNKSVFMDKSRIYLMPRERSFDIDDYVDFKIVDMFIREKNELQ